MKTYEENIKDKEMKNKNQTKQKNTLSKKSKILKIVLISILSLLTISIISFFIYVSDYYEADEVAKNILTNNTDLIVNDNFIHLKSDSNVGIIFYPGGKVEFTSYLPLMEKYQKENINAFLVEMPFNLAMFNTNAANNIISSNSNIDSWYIIGHSLGGTFASVYAENNSAKIDGLILLGSYSYSNYPIEKTLTIAGSLDYMYEDITYTTNLITIDGGNHAQVRKLWKTRWR